MTAPRAPDCRPLEQGRGVVMDPDFLRELVVLLVFIGLYLIGSAVLLKGHKADLSAVHPITGGTNRASVEEGEAVPTRLNRRRKAIAREEAEREARRGPDTTEG